ncbi:MAG: hypothetical protein CMF59_00150 [Leptospiraceae bacterium]|nr:hypothetical protein [Leptospiraceae bacterium]
MFHWKKALCIASLGFSPGCLSTLPEKAPNESTQCLENYYEARRRQEKIADGYHFSNGVISFSGAVLWFGFIEGLAIPAIGIPVSYYYFEEQTEENMNALQKECSKGQI